MLNQPKSTPTRWAPITAQSASNSRNPQAQNVFVGLEEKLTKAKLLLQNYKMVVLSVAVMNALTLINTWFKRHLYIDMAAFLRSWKYSHQK